MGSAIKACLTVAKLFTAQATVSSVLQLFIQNVPPTSTLLAATFAHLIALAAGRTSESPATSPLSEEGGERQWSVTKTMSR